MKQEQFFSHYEIQLIFLNNDLPQYEYHDYNYK